MTDMMAQRRIELNALHFISSWWRASSCLVTELNACRGYQWDEVDWRQLAGIHCIRLSRRGLSRRSVTCRLVATGFGNSLFQEVCGFLTHPPPRVATGRLLRRRLMPGNVHLPSEVER